MHKKPSDNLLVGLDIGTSKVVAIVGSVKENGELNIIGIGTSISKGLKRGVVVNIDATIEAIQQAVDEAELMSGCSIYSVFVGIAGNHINSLNSHGIVAIREKEVTHGDLSRVIDAARAVAIPADQRVLHVIPREFIVDDQDSVREPIGMSGVRLEAKVHIVTCANSAAQNITKSIQKCNLDVDDVILEQLASSYAVLTDDERELGVCLVDIGGGTTDIAIFVNGSIAHTAVIPIAGDQVTNDIAVALRTPTQAAEEIKIRYAAAMSKLTHPDETIDVQGMGGREPRKIARRSLSEVIEPRYEELFLLIQAEIRRSGLESSITAGIVLTGGSSKMDGLVDLAEEVFHMSVRLGMPHSISGLSSVIQNPIYATGVGLLLYGMKLLKEGKTRLEGGHPLYRRFIRWLQNHF